MARETIEPVTVDDPNAPGGGKATKTSHPAFGQISVTRPSGHASLYGSDFHHQHYVSLEIHRSVLHRDLSRDWPLQRELIVSLAMSEAQWAAFVSSVGAGGGVQCTLEYTERDGVIPGLPDPAPRGEQFTAEANQAMVEALELMDELRADIANMGLSKKKADALELQLRVARDKLRSNLPFVAKQFEEHVESTIEHAKAEIHGYMMNTLTRAGLAHLASPDQLPIAIEDQSGDEA